MPFLEVVFKMMEGCCTGGSIWTERSVCMWLLGHAGGCAGNSSRASVWWLTSSSLLPGDFEWLKCASRQGGAPDCLAMGVAYGHGHTAASPWDSGADLSQCCLVVGTMGSSPFWSIIWSSFLICEKCAVCVLALGQTGISQTGLGSLWHSSQPLNSQYAFLVISDCPWIFGLEHPVFSKL